MEYQSQRARAVWGSCLASAFRTGLACTIVGCATLFGPAYLRRQVTFPAFSYVTVILIVTDATLGDTLRGCWHALYATFQGACPAILSLWIVGPARLTTCTTALAVGLSAFVVVLPENTHLVSRRITLGQIVIIYVIAFINGEHTETVMHPVHVAASTALGALACVLALLLPFPSLACFEVRKNCKIFMDNAVERLKLFVNAFSSEDNTALLSQARLLDVAGAKLLHSINSKKDSVEWERFPLKFFQSNCVDTGRRLQDIQTSLKGMEIALSGCSSFPSSRITMLHNQELKEGMKKVEESISRNLIHVAKGGCLPYHFGSSTIPESSGDPSVNTFLQTLHATIPIANLTKDHPSCFYLFCLRLLHHKTSVITSSTATTTAYETSSTDSSKKYGWWLFFERVWISLSTNTISRRRLMPAFKCALSLGLSVLFGLIYSKENGYWSGLPVAISLVSSREATFKVANIKAQGTVLGTVYGVVGCFMFERFVQVRFLSLLPWFLFTSFLRRSKMYGQAGGISAVIGAVLILGRKNFGPPSEFAAARIIETFIGLSCSIVVEVMLQPTRASALAKLQISKTLKSLHDCVISMCVSSRKSRLEESQSNFKKHVHDLKNIIEEAEAEPNFWFLPFPSASYHKLSGSLSKTLDFLLFGAHAIGIIEQESERIKGSNDNQWKERMKSVDSGLDLFKDMAAPFIKSLEEISSFKSLSQLENELVKNDVVPEDPEQGKSPVPKMFRLSGPALEGEIEKILGCYLEQSGEVLGMIQENEVDDGEGGGGLLKVKLILGLNTLAFCMSNLVRETKEIEKDIEELIQRENPRSHVNLQDISCKINALRN